MGIKNAVFLNVKLCDCCKSRSGGGTYRLYHQVEKSQRPKNNFGINLQLNHFANDSLILFNLMIEAICSSETLVLIAVTRHHIQEGGILQ
jgi:hypothetical protein